MRPPTLRRSSLLPAPVTTVVGLTDRRESDAAPASGVPSPDAEFSVQMPCFAPTLADAMPQVGLNWSHQGLWYTRRRRTYRLLAGATRKMERYAPTVQRPRAC